MLKLFGSAFIIIGCGGVAYSGILGCRTRIELLTALERLLQKGIYILLGQQQNTIIFLKNVSCGNKELEGELFRMGEALEKHLYPNGDMAWRKGPADFLEKYGFRHEDLEIIKGCGAAFFEKSSDEIRAGLQNNLELMELIKEYELKQQRDIKKVWLPVSIMGGIACALVFA